MATPIENNTEGLQKILQMSQELPQAVNPDNFVKKTEIVNNFSTTEEGFVADARALKELNDRKLAMELLWVNASPSSSFSPATIDLELGEYNSVQVILIYAPSVQWDVEITIVVGRDGVANLVLGQTMYRPIVVRTTGVTFEKCQIYGSYNGTQSENNERLIPVAIFGIKG